MGRGMHLFGLNSYLGQGLVQICPAAPGFYTSLYVVALTKPVTSRFLILLDWKRWRHDDCREPEDSQSGGGNGLIYFRRIGCAAQADDGGLTLSPAAAYAARPLYLVDTIGNPAEQMHAPQPAAAVAATGGGRARPSMGDAGDRRLSGKRSTASRGAVDRHLQPAGLDGRPALLRSARLRPAGRTIDAEFWLIPTINRHGHSEIVTQYEVEIGFPGRIQMDLYLIPRFEGSGGKTFIDESIEFRYAFANWDEIWGNPTYYIELIHQDQGPDQIEQKLLFGGDFASPGWHWGWDLTFQHSFGEDFEDTYETTAGVSYTLLDNKFDVGAEFKLQENTFHGDRRHFHDNTFVGPSLQYRPLPRMHIDFTPLIGMTHESPAAEVYMIVGFEF